jgi:two-component system OmpR family sensor kinase
MIKDEKQKARLHSIFERLNLLIDEFAKIEKITSRNFELELKPYKMSDLLDASIDLLMVEHPERFVTKEIVRDYVVKVDFELFTLVLKNLLDNAVKYSVDKQVRVRIDNGRIEIINKGEPLPHPLEEYFKPFHASQGGLGLGLYIVKSILDIHHMHLDYLYKKEEKLNVFMID